MLVDKGADIFAKDKNGYTILDLASSIGDQEVIAEVTKLLEANNPDQDLLISKLSEVPKWMQSYEQERYAIENKKAIDGKTLPPILDPAQMTPQFDDEGLCFGLSAYLAHCVMTDEQIARKTQAGEKLSDNPYTMESFSQK